MGKYVENRENRIGRNYLLKTGFSAIIFIVVIIISFSYILGTVNENKRSQKDINEIDENLTDLYISVINQETSQRGFNLTKNQEFLEPFNQGKQVFKEKEELLIQYIKLYPEFSGIILNTIEKGSYWTNHYGTPQIELSMKGSHPSEASLEDGKKALDSFRESYQTAHDFVEKRSIEIQNGFSNKLIFLFSLSSLLFILMFILIWIWMYRKFKSIIIPIVELSQCVKEYTQNKFSKNTPIYKANNELGDLISHTEIMRIELEKNRSYMEKKAYTDSLTGVFNRRYFDMTLQNEWNRQMRLSNKISIILFDIDYFKQFNDNYGHVAGDECLKKIAETMQEQFQYSMDVPVRYGGEEFAIILIEQDENIILNKIEQFRKAIENLKIPHGASEISDWVTISAGVATIVPNKDLDIKSFINLADEALYKSKLNGRNQVTYSSL
jgi:diguanylate cyclase (GGDEF)-like protein